MSNRRNQYDLYWWLGYYTEEINNICNRNLFMRDMGLLTEEKLQQSNEEIYKNIMYSKNIEALINRDEEDNL